MPFQKGNILGKFKRTWNKGLKGYKVKYNPNSGYKKGHPDLVPKESRKKQGEKMKGNNWGFQKGQVVPKGEFSSGWKGDGVGYSSLHYWIRGIVGNPKTCEHCGKVGYKTGRSWNLDWANKSHTYQRNLNDWIGLCRKCHINYDKKQNQIEGIK